MAFSGLIPAALAALTLAPQQAPTPWQQGVSYRIESRLDEASEVLDGRARVWYRNESPDTLTDFYLHLYLNAFRPNSEWARTDLTHGITTFQDLGPEEHGFERLRKITVNGRDVQVSYPYAPDSTVVRLELPAPLPPKGEITLDYDWQARPSIVARRQGRRGRHYDFAQWYPRVAVYDLEGWRPHPLYRQGEFYSEFATYDVTMDVARDQVIGATGVPVSGDPGWEAAAVAGTGPIQYARDFYDTGTPNPPCVVRDGVRTCGIAARELPPTGEPLGLLPESAEAGRKLVRWHAENVHHFAWSTSPDYIYEQGEWNGTAIHVLYQPGDEAEWGGGKAVQRTAVALQWLNHIYGAYPYPQVTNLHRIEGGGTEFPMMVMNGSASLGLILHEVGHIYTFGILANNEWYEGWLDEGFTSFQTAWFNEEQGAGRNVWLGSEVRILNMELHGIAEPVTLQAERYSEMGVYSSMIYTKGSLVFWMLREMVGKEKMLQILRTYFERYKFRHVDQYAFQSVAEEVSGVDLDWFFGEWLHANGVVDYAVDGVETRRDGDGWATRVGVDRKGGLRMPVPIRLEGDGQVRDTVVPGDAVRGEHVIHTRFKPDQVQLDPDLVTMDWNAMNNAWPSGPLSGKRYARGLDHFFSSPPTYRDRASLGFFPLLWGNDVGGLTAGFQARTSYLGDVRQALVRVGLPGVDAGSLGDASDAFDPGSIYFRVENPIVFDRPRYGMSLEAFAGEGRGYLSIMGERDVSPWPLSSPRRSVRAWVTAAGVYDGTYITPGRWDAEDHVGAEAGVGYRSRGGAWSTDVDGSTGLSSDGKVWFRGSFMSELTASARSGSRIGLRLFAGGLLAHQHGGWNSYHAPQERKFFLSGGDPYAALVDPWFRSAGSLLDKEGWADGGGMLLGYHPAAALSQMVSLTLDARTAPAGLGSARSRWEVQARAFGGLAFGSVGDLPSGAEALDYAPPADFGWGHAFASAGAGIELGRRGSPIRLRFDVPFFVADPEMASRETTSQLGFRYSVRLIGYR